MLFPSFFKFCQPPPPLLDGVHTNIFCTPYNRRGGGVLAKFEKGGGDTTYIIYIYII